MSRFGKRLLMLGRRSQLDRDLEDELSFHLEMNAEENGDGPEARRRLGNVTAHKEACRELWIFANLEAWWRDIHYAIRTLAKTPGFTVVAVLALALGIGADTAVFTIANGAFSWNLGLDHIEKIVLVGTTDKFRNQRFGESYPDFRDIQAQTKSFAGFAAYSMNAVNVSDKSGLPERYLRVLMSASGFAAVEQKPMLGRDFSPRDELPGAPPVLMLTYHVWQDRYGRDPAILGKTVRINDVPTVVIGVMPPGRRFPEDTDLWTPLIADRELEKRDNRSLTVFARLADGVKTGMAGTELEAIGGRLADRYPATNKGLTAGLQPIGQITGAYSIRPLLTALWAAVGFVLLIACADVANMLLARGAGRMREISIRAAVGAGRARIMRQLLIESVVLSIAGGFFGWLVALGGLRWFDAGTSRMVKPAWLNLSLDRTAFAYLAAISIGTGILFGLAPAMRLAKIDVHSAMKDGGQGVAGSRRVLSVANLLVVLEMALCLVLLAGAGLTIRSAVNLYGAPVGVDTTNVLTMRLDIPEAKYPLPGDQVAFHRALKTQLDPVAGVEEAAIASHLPFGGWMQVFCQLEDMALEPDRVPQTGAIVVNSAYFRVMRVKPLRGRTFRDSEGVTGEPVVLVNDSFARKTWPGQEPIGKRLRLVRNRKPEAWLTVVGVLPDILQNSRRPLDRDPLIYLPYSEEPRREMFIAARTHVPPSALAVAFRHKVQDLDEYLPVYEVRTLENRLAQNRLSVSLVGGMFSVFAGVALVLASVGLYAVIAHSVSQRTQEIGVRMAIGGARRDILRLVYAQGMRPLALGMAIGLPAAFGLTHVLGTILVGVSPGDPVTFAIVVLVLTAAGVLGCAVPAHRAIRVDPIVALRYE
jgi:predicted permease